MGADPRLRGFRGSRRPVGGTRTWWLVRGGTLMALAALAGAPAAHGGDLAGQAREPGPRAEGRTLDVGLRLGNDFELDAFVLGAFAAVPVDPWRRVALFPGFDLTFLDGLTEWQADADLAIFPLPSRTVYVGGGAAFRNSVYLDAEGELLPERETRTGASAFIGARTRTERLVTHLEFRRVFIDDFAPTSVTLGIAIPIPLTSPPQ